MDKSNLDDHCIYYSWQESFRRNVIAIIVNKSWKCNTWMQKWQYDLGSFPRQTIQYHDKPSLCFNYSNVKEAETDWFYEDLQDLLELTSKKKMFFSSEGAGKQKQEVKGHLE